MTAGAKRVHVIGAGISGLTTAWFLAERGADVVVTDAASEPGGLIHTIELPEGLVETAARTLTRTPRIDALLRDLKIDVVTAAPSARRRYIHRNARSRRWPLSIAESGTAAWRVSRAWLRRDLRPRDTDTVEEWGDRIAGRAALEWLIAPGLQGVYASAADVLSARAVFRARMPRGEIVAPRRGMGALVRTLRQRLEARGVRFEFNRRETSIDADTPTAICTDAPAAASLLATRAPAVASAISQIQLTTLRTVTAFFQPHHDDLRGFGVLFPRAGSIRALGVVFNADAFPDRSGCRSETWIYDGDGLCDNRAVVDAMTFDRSVFTSRPDTPLGDCLVPPLAEIPVYDHAVSRAIDIVDNALPAGIALAGNYLGRLGVSKLVDGAAEAADRLTTT